MHLKTIRTVTVALLFASTSAAYAQNVDCYQQGQETNACDGAEIVKATLIAGKPPYCDYECAGGGLVSAGAIGAGVLGGLALICLAGACDSGGGGGSSSDTQ